MTAIVHGKQVGAKHACTPQMHLTAGIGSSACQGAHTALEQTGQPLSLQGSV
jgi:hypothetical protein